MTNKKTVHDALHRIQKELKAPKNQYNSFGKYNYRSCEDILEGLKAVLQDGETVTLNDEVVMVGQRYYVKATASLCVGDSCISVIGMAREEESKKGMDAAQVTGSTSSYARKYALNALFLIDDTKDPDSNEKGVEKVEREKVDKKPKEETILPGEEFSALQKEIQAVKTSEELTEAKNKASAAKPRMSPEQIKVIANEITKASATLVVEKREE